MAKAEFVLVAGVTAGLWPGPGAGGPQTNWDMRGHKGPEAPQLDNLALMVFSKIISAGKHAHT
jgi:hypothetical protein